MTSQTKNLQVVTLRPVDHLATAGQTRGLHNGEKPPGPSTLLGCFLPQLKLDQQREKFALDAGHVWEMFQQAEHPMGKYIAVGIQKVCMDRQIGISAGKKQQQQQQMEQKVNHTRRRDCCVDWAEPE